VTLDEAILEAGRAVASTPRDATVREFYDVIPSLVVRLADRGDEENYAAITMRQHRLEIHEGAEVLVVMTNRSADA
jgi:hypothetical protein